MRLLSFFPLLLAFILTPAPAVALKNENLLVGVPSAYKIAYKTSEEHMIMTEMIPKEQNLKNWSEMLTVQVFMKNRKLQPVTFYKIISGLFVKNCKGSTSQLIKKGFENGYAFSFFFMSCRLNPNTGKPETVWFKTIRGKDSFYVVQKAWRKTPSKAGIIRWSKFLRRVAVCDTRRAINKCPRSAPTKK